MCRTLQNGINSIYIVYSLSFLPEPGSRIRPLRQNFKLNKEDNMTKGFGTGNRAVYFFAGLFMLVVALLAVSYSGALEALDESETIDHGLLMLSLLVGILAFVFITLFFDEWQHDLSRQTGFNIGRDRCIPRLQAQVEARIIRWLQSDSALQSQLTFRDFVDEKFIVNILNSSSYGLTWRDYYNLVIQKTDNGKKNKFFASDIFEIYQNSQDDTPQLGFVEDIREILDANDGEIRLYFPGLQIDQIFKLI